MFQYGEGSVGGVTTTVDLDTFNGDLTQLLALGGGAPAPAPACGGKPAAPTKPTACGGLKAGEGLSQGDSVKSCDGRFELAMQSDGNAVLYSEGNALWSTATNGKGGDVLVMQGDGNLVVYSTTGCALWNSVTEGHAGATLALQDDGNLVVYGGGRALWNTGTGGIPAAPTACGALAPGQGLAPGEPVLSCDGKHELIMQNDGNLVLYHLGVATWSSRTNGTPSRFAVMQGDGNLVVYEFGGHPTFSTGTSGHDGAHLAIQDDGNLVIYQGSTAIWNTGTEGR
jgi:hypothetical protein